MFLWFSKFLYICFFDPLYLKWQSLPVVLTDWLWEMNPFWWPCKRLWALLRPSMDTPAPCFLLSLWNNISGCDLATHQVVCSQSPFSFPRAALKFKLWFLLVLQMYVGFLHMLSSYLLGSFLLSLGAQQENLHRWVELYISEAWGVMMVPVGQLQGSKGKVSPEGFFIESMVWLVGSMSLWIPAMLLSAFLPAFSHPSVKQLTMTYFGWGKIEISLFDSIIHSWGSRILNHMFTLSLNLWPVGEILSQEGLSWPWVVSLWGRDEVSKIKLFLLPSPVHITCTPSPPPNSVLEPFCWKPLCTSTTALLSMVDSWFKATAVSIVRIKVCMQCTSFSQVP